MWQSFFLNIGWEGDRTTLWIFLLPWLVLKWKGPKAMVDSPLKQEAQVILRIWRRKCARGSSPTQLQLECHWSLCGGYPKPWPGIPMLQVLNVQVFYIQCNLMSSVWKLCQEMSLFSLTATLGSQLPTHQRLPSIHQLISNLKRNKGHTRTEF